MYQNIKFFGKRKCDTKASKCLHYTTTYKRDYVDLTKQHKAYYTMYELKPPPPKDDGEKPKKRRRLRNFYDPFADHTEWTPNCILGKLVEPTIIPPEEVVGETEEHIQEGKCVVAAFEELNREPEIIIKRPKGKPTFSIYQTDYKEGYVYEPEELDPPPKVIKPPPPPVENLMLLTQGIDKSKEEESQESKKHYREPPSRPLNFTFEDSTRFAPTADILDWPFALFSQGQRLSEYRDKFSKLGCIIMRNNLHDHSECTKWRCEHFLADKCIDYR